MHNENIHQRHPEAQKKESLIRERVNDFGQFLNPFKKSFKMNSTTRAQANTEVCCLEVSLGLGVLARVNEHPCWCYLDLFESCLLVVTILSPKNKMLELNSQRPLFSLSMMDYL
jgi:hypothetical protein